MTFVEQRSDATLTYGELYAFDADRRPLDAQLSATIRGVAIQVDARGARYPVTIDPFVQQQALTVSGLAANDEFGYSVALDESGTTAVVGVPGRDVSLGNLLNFADNGIAYVFVRAGESWQLLTSLSGTGSVGVVGQLLGQTGRRFGHAVAIKGDTIVVTAPFEDVDGHTDKGAPPMCSSETVPLGLSHRSSREER